MDSREAALGKIQIRIRSSQASKVDRKLLGGEDSTMKPKGDRVGAQESGALSFVNTHLITPIRF